VGWEDRADALGLGAPAPAASTTTAAPAETAGSGWEARADALMAAPTPPPVSKGESFGRGALQGASLGFGDEASAAIDTATSHIPGYRWLAQKINAVGGSGAGLPVDAPSITYQQRRDAYRAANEAAHAANPKTYLGGELAGGLATAAVPVAGAAKAATLGAKVGLGALEGAAIGGAAGLGNSKADLTQGQIGGAALDTAIGAAGGAVVGAAAPVVAQSLATVGEKARSALAKRLLTNFGGTTETGKATDTFVKELRPAVDQLKKEVLTPEGLKIATAARTDPETALDALQAHVRTLTKDRASYYKAIDDATGGFHLNDYTSYLSDQIAQRAKINTPQAKNEIKVLGEMIKDAGSTWGTQKAPLVPTLALREHVTGLQGAAGDVIGSINESERSGLMHWRAEVAKDFLNQHLDTVAKDYPQLAPIVDNIREMNRRVSAWLAPEDALKDRVGKLATKALRQSVAGAGTGATVGGIEGYVHGGVKGAVGGAVAGALGGAVAHRVAGPALAALTRGGLRAGAAVAPGVSAAATNPVVARIGRLAATDARNVGAPAVLHALAGSSDE